jgi:hypothetical protein
MTQLELDKERINDFIEGSFVTIKQQMEINRLLNSEPSPMLLFLTKKNVNGQMVYGSSCSFIKKESGELIKQEQEIIKMIVDVDGSKIICGCCVTYSENELRMKFVDYVEKNVKYRVHNYESMPIFV